MFDRFLLATTLALHRLGNHHRHQQYYSCWVHEWSVERFGNEQTVNLLHAERFCDVFPKHSRAWDCEFGLESHQKAGLESVQVATSNRDARKPPGISWTGHVWSEHQPSISLLRQQRLQISRLEDFHAVTFVKDFGLNQQSVHQQTRHNSGSTNRP